ncbi:MAG: hypothetical protein JXR91_11850 [Deltaproteobacteria bacterium]|nr:hypothetical protein [Deltaproteobacteria bacterium]
MASKDREIKEQQFDAAKKEFETFAASLKEQGLDDKQSGKNAIYRSLKANVKKARNRIKSIDAAKAHVETIRQKDTKAAPVPKNTTKKAK